MAGPDKTTDTEQTESLQEHLDLVEGLVTFGRMAQSESRAIVTGGRSSPANGTWETFEIFTNAQKTTPRQE